MTNCPNCGSANESGAHFCVSCGTPLVVAEPPHDSRRGTALLALGLVGLALVSFAITVAVRHDGSSSASPPTTTTVTNSKATSTTADNATTTVVASATTTTLSTATTTAAPRVTDTTTSELPTETSTTITTVPETPPPPLDAVTQLDNQVDNDRATVESFVGMWVTQLSSKAPGMVIDGQTLTADDVLAVHNQLNAEFGTILLSSSEYNFKAPGLYVDIVPQGFADPDSALQLCFDQGIGRNDCFAKFITHDPSITKTTKLQP